MITGMTKLISTVGLCLVVCTFCYGQGASFPDREEGKTTRIKDLVEQETTGSFQIEALCNEIYNYHQLIFLVEEDDYIIPIQLMKKDLGAEKRFRALNIQKGDTLIINGRLEKIFVNANYYKGLDEATILRVRKRIGDYPIDEDADDSFQRVEQKPSFNGGDVGEFSLWVNKHLRYPNIAKENGVQGRVTVQFTIETDGSVTNVRVLRGVDESLDREAVRVVSRSPKWTPGKNKGKNVRVTYTFPVIFQLR